jgi:hypothetical protein
MTRPRTKQPKTERPRTERPRIEKPVPALVTAPRGRRRFSEMPRSGSSRRLVILAHQCRAWRDGTESPQALLFRWRQALGVGPLPEGATFLPVQIADDGAAVIEAREASVSSSAPSIIVQPQFVLDELDADIARTEAKQPNPPVGETGRDETPRRPAFPEHLACEEVTLEIERTACPSCGSTLHPIGVTDERDAGLGPGVAGHHPHSASQVRLSLLRDHPPGRSARAAH